ncbi:hypothetical protein As57867_019428, partial [Aphanomyces stellatus]
MDEMCLVTHSLLKDAAASIKNADAVIQASNDHPVVTDETKAIIMNEFVHFLTENVDIRNATGLAFLAQAFVWQDKTMVHQFNGDSDSIVIFSKNTPAETTTTVEPMMLLDDDDYISTTSTKSFTAAADESNQMDTEADECGISMTSDDDDTAIDDVHPPAASVALSTADAIGSFKRLQQEAALVEQKRRRLTDVTSSSRHSSSKSTSRTSSTGAARSAKDEAPEDEAPAAADDVETFGALVEKTLGKAFANKWLRVVARAPWTDWTSPFVSFLPGTTPPQV